MLVQFKVRNFLSFKDETILDMRAINSYKEHQSNLIDNGRKEKLIKVASIYGANASGKSNLHLAMQCFQTIVSKSLNNSENPVGNLENDNSVINLYYKPFAFNEDEDENTEFQIIMILNNYEYTYGFEYKNECIEEEWLYRKSYKTNRTSIIFERSKQDIDFGSTVKSDCNKYKSLIPKETLILSLFNKLNIRVDIFKALYNGIMEIFISSSTELEDTDILVEFLYEVIDDEKSKKSLLTFLSAIDTGIKDIYYEKKEDSIFYFAVHEDEEGIRYSLDLLFESEGTIKSMFLFMYFKSIIRHNKTIFIDELNIKLHPLLLKFMIDLFYEDDAKAQLIYTTHDTTLLDKKFFRRDQVFFVQKDQHGHSELVGLSDFKVRNDSSFEKDYLSGVYGGIPMLKDFSMKEE